MRAKKIAALLAMPVFLWLSLPAEAVAEPSKAECLLLSEIGKDGTLEVRLGQLAQSRATNKEVLAFAKRLVEDHTRANDALIKAAKEDHIALPMELSISQKHEMADFISTPNDAFDRKYMDDMVAGHRKILEAVAMEIKTGSGNSKKWAEQTLPIIQAHQKDAERLDAKLSAHAK